MLKVTRPSEDRSVIEAQNSCLEHLAAAGIAAPRPVAATDGRTLVEVAGPDGDAGLARLLTWIPGERMADLPHPPALLEDLGRFLEERLTPDVVAAARAAASKLLIFDGDRYGLFHDRFRHFLVGLRADPIAAALVEG